MGKPFFKPLVDVVAPQRQDAEMEREGFELRDQQRHRHHDKMRDLETYREAAKKRYANNPESIKKAIIASVAQRKLRDEAKTVIAISNRRPGEHVFVRPRVLTHNRRCVFCDMWETSSRRNIKLGRPNNCVD